MDNLVELEKVLLSNRHIIDAQSFFQPAHPAQFKLESKAAVSLIKQAIKRQAKILVFGDYDADGICATAIIWRTLFDLGAEVKPFIPHREKHGYGITVATLQEIFNDPLVGGKPDLIITVDNGIVAHEAIAFAKKQGVQVIITDHHSAEKTLPPADAIVHSTDLCGASVAWILCHQLTNLHSTDQLDLVGLATIADQVPLTNMNRAFAWHGLKALQKTKRPGLLALLKEAEFKAADIDEYAVNYVLAPRINAMGRLKHGLEALRLLCTKNIQQAQELAKLLDSTNKARQDLTFQALAQIEVNTEQKIIITHSANYHEGVIGLIAGKLSEKYYQPSIAISVGPQIAKGSARSVKGINITDLLREIKDDLLSVGGHPLAAGFSFESSKLALIIEKLQVLAQKIEPALLKRSLAVDCVLPSHLFNFDLIDLISKFAPFGPQNKAPLFSFPNLKIKNLTQMGEKKQHLRVTARDQAGREIKAVAWNMGEQNVALAKATQITIIGSPEINLWRDKKYLQVKVREFQID